MAHNECSMNNTYAVHQESTANMDQTLKLENEDLRQAVYCLKQKHETQEIILKELQETLDSLEQSHLQEIAKMEQKLRKEQDRYRDMQQEHKNYCSSLETALAEKLKENKELHNKLLEVTTEPVQTPTVQLNCTSDTTALEEEVANLNNQLKMMTMKVEDQDSTINILKDENTELEDILKVTKEQLTEKNEALEQAREKLTVYRLEIESKENIPLNNECKGNSLFAEVEDRRQADVAKLGAFRNKYTEAKRAVVTKDAIIRKLKAEKAALMQWNEGPGNITDKESNLIKMYKDRIVELEDKLNSRNENIEPEVQPSDSPFFYLESLVASKKKEIRQLESKIQNNSAHAIIQEEIKYNLTKQLRYWKYKAMSLEDQIGTIKSKLEPNQFDAE